MACFKDSFKFLPYTNDFKYKFGVRVPLLIAIVRRWRELQMEVAGFA
ncbi:MAG: hypothetical protein ABIT96_11545 [Ferruginibacter sp.]